MLHTLNSPKFVLGIEMLLYHKIIQFFCAVEFVIFQYLIFKIQQKQIEWDKEYINKTKVIPTKDKSELRNAETTIFLSLKNTIKN